MYKVFVIILITLGTVSALLIPLATRIARWLWPGPTVKGPGDVYVQAFQAIVCHVSLGLSAVIASIVSFLLMRHMGWSAGQWLSVVPLAIAMIGVALFWFRPA